ncbi:MAG: hypothetical protein CMI63_20715 [Parvularcula sp.]|nr:hypothetical protein [Parvularcula sp.]
MAARLIARLNTTIFIVWSRGCTCTNVRRPAAVEFIGVGRAIAFIGALSRRRIERETGAAASDAAS